MAKVMVIFCRAHVLPSDSHALADRVAIVQRVESEMLPHFLPLRMVRFKKYHYNPR